MNHAAKPDPRIVTRNISLGAKNIGNERWYMGGDPVATAFYNALTLIFPAGEHYFIDSARPFRKSSPPELAKRIADFIKQEALHTREHEAFNQQVERAGYDPHSSIRRAQEKIDELRELPPLDRLVLTSAFEHLTAILAHELLSDERHFAGAPSNVRQLWRWHALEEIEHKSVCYDAWLHATRDWTGIRRYFERARALFWATGILARVQRLNMRDLLAQDNLSGAGLGIRLLRYLLGKGGIVRAMLPAWISWLRPGFHPWDHDDRDLIAPVAAEFAGSAAN